MKPKRQYKKSKRGSYDLCQTPPYALDPLVRPLKLAGFETVWEPACGEGLLVNGLRERGFEVAGTDIIGGVDFFKFLVPPGIDCIVTNPPYSMKYQWIQRCYELNMPWALLLPVETLGARAAQVMFDTLGIQVIFMSPRVDFKMPDKGWSGKGAQFPTAWFLYGFNMKRDMVFAKLNKVKYE